MDIEQVNSVLARAIMGLQEGELAALAERVVSGRTAYDIPTPDELVHRGRGLPEGARDVSKKVLSDALHGWEQAGRYDTRYGGKIKTKGGGKRTKSESAVLKLVGKGIALQLVSKVLLHADEFRRLKNNERKALLSLVAKGALKVFDVPGPLPGVHRPSKIGASESSHYWMVPA